MGGVFDGDNDFDYAIIMANFSSGPPAGNGTVRGRVNDSFNMNVSNVLVSVDNGQDFFASVITNGTGEYIFNDNVSSGNYVVNATNGTASASQSNVDVESGNISWVNLTILGSEPGNSSGNSSISGYVLDQGSSNGISGATIEIYCNSSSYSCSTHTNENGLYNFSNLSSGTYDIKASKDQVFEQTWSSNVNVPDNDTYVENINFTVSTGVEPGPGEEIGNITIRGYVYQDFTPEIPVSNVNVTIKTKDLENDVLNYTSTNYLGYFEVTFEPNQTAIDDGKSDVQIVCTADGYETRTEQENINHMGEEMMSNGYFEMREIWLEKIWDITTWANGTILNNASQSIEGVSIMAEGSNYFMNTTQSASNGSFIIGTISGDIEFYFNKQGYFINATEDLTMPGGQYDLGIIYLEEKPDENAYIIGNVTCNDQPLTNINLMLYDPAHPFESEKGFFDLPLTNSTGEFNISTYAGDFYLMTWAKIVGESRDGPPLGLGGYVNDVVSVSVGENGVSTAGIDLSAADPDEIQVNLNFTQLNVTTAELYRTIIGNAKVLRFMTDTNLDGNISSDEASALIDIINSSLTEADSYDAELLFLRMPFQNFKLDDEYFTPTQTLVEISGLIGSTNLSTSFTIFMNETFEPADSVDDSQDLHSIEIYGYYSNPAFGMNIQIRLPDGMVLKNVKQELATITGLDEGNVTIVPHEDPDWTNDTEFYESVLMLIGESGADVFAEINNGYCLETPIDTNGDGDYDFLRCKIKFNTTVSGTFTTIGTLRSQSGIDITSNTVEGAYGAGSKMVELYFTGENIYRKVINGPYNVVVDIYYGRNSTDIWFDSMNKTTDAYSHSDFDPPLIFFTGTISDAGLDDDSDGYYDYLILSLRVNVGVPEYYIFEGDIGTCDFSFEGDPRITGIEAGVTFVDTGEQWCNISFDGGLIYEKGCNGSMWANVRVRSPWEGQIDEIFHMTGSYQYTQFSPPPPESCIISGNVTDAFGNPLEAEIRLRNIVSRTENTTQTNSSNGYYIINARAGTYEMEVSTFSGSYEYYREIVVLETNETYNETYNRNIMLLPQWHMCKQLNFMMDDWQYASGEHIFINISTYWPDCWDCMLMANANTTLEIFKEYRNGDEYYGDEFVTILNDTTDGNGEVMYEVNTSGFSNGQYAFKMMVTDGQYVSRGDAWGVQLSSLSLDFDIDKNNYRPGSAGTGTYTLSYISNSSEVIDATYGWKIKTWDWMGEHILTSGSFSNSVSGNGSFPFTIPSSAQDGDWYDVQLTATDPNGNDVQSWRGFGITTGSSIDNVNDSAVGTPGNYNALVLNVTINVTTADTYRLSASLEDVNRGFITWNETESYLSPGETVVQIFFDGDEIQNGGRDPYRGWIGLYRGWNELDSLEYTLVNTYDYSQFSRPDVGFETGLTYYVINGSSGYEALIVNASINASIPGDYNVHANLHVKELQPGGWYEWHPVSWNKSGTVAISGGGDNATNSTVNISIRFEGSEIYNSQRNGPYNVNFNLNKVIGSYEEWVTWYDPDEYPIPYNYTEFSKPDAFVEGINDLGPVGGDLQINVTVNVSSGQGGTYRIGSDLHNSEWQWIAWYDTLEPLGEGNNNVIITFSGESIYGSGFDGPYKLNVRLERNEEWLGGTEFDTDSHNYTDFSLPGAVFVGTYSDGGYDEDSDGYYDYVRITAPVSFNDTGWYEIGGDLYQESGGMWNWISWANRPVEVTESGTQNITIDFNGYEVRSSELEGYYGVTLWLRSMDTGGELGRLEFTTDTYYYINEFGQPSVRLIKNATFPDDSCDNEYLNVTMRINSSELGDYRVMGHLHKDTGYGWEWITFAEQPFTIATEGESDIVLSFDVAVLQASGYNGPYVIRLELFDSNWNQLDSINDYQTATYDFSGLGDLRPIYFNGSHDDYINSDGTYLIVNVSLQVNETGYYSINGDLHKSEGWEWNWLAGDWMDNLYLTQDSSPQVIALQFDVVEILYNIEELDLTEFDTGSTFDIDVWVRRSGEWTELDHLSTVSSTYSVNDFASSGANIVSVNDNGYNESGDSKYEYLNVTAVVNFTEVGNYEFWCNLEKQSGFDWYWLGWQNSFTTISSADLTDGYKVETITLQFNGEQISSAGYDGPYNLYVELRNFDTATQLARYEGQTDNYNATDFVGSSVEFDEDSMYATGVDTDSDGYYNYLSVDINVTAAASINVELMGDLHKQSGWDWDWIAWENNWTSLTDDTIMNLRFDGEMIYNSGLNGPYQIRLEIRDTDNWKLLDTIDNQDVVLTIGSVETTDYTYTNFQPPSGSINTNNLSDWGNDTDTDSLYDYLEVNVSITTDSSDTYEIAGHLYSDTYGWQDIDWKNVYTELSAGNSTVQLQFDGIKIRNKGINGPYKVRIELRDSEFRMIDSYDPYTTSSYVSTDFQQSGAEIVEGNDRITGDGDLELNVTVNCSTSGYYWVGADLHKQSGWDWDWIAWESNNGEDYLTAGQEENVTILFSGETIHNSGIDGPYHIRIELRDVTSWTEQDVMEKYITSNYYYTNFSSPSLSFDEANFSNWGNDTDDTDALYNYLDINVTINSSSVDTYWLHADLEKRDGYNWQWIAWKGQDVSLDDSGDQEVKIQFDGERISSAGLDGPYTVRLMLFNLSTWTQIDTVDSYTTDTYSASEFQTSLVEFIENDTSPSDRGIGTQGSYMYLEVNVTVNSSTANTYWLHADLQKKTGYDWQWIAWDGQEIIHTGGGNETFTILFDGSIIRNSGTDGPYQVRLELNSASGDWKQYDIIELYDTIAYNCTDFLSSGLELVDLTNGNADVISNGNLQINVTVNSSISGTYKINGDLCRDSPPNWWWISWNTTQITVDGTGEQTFPLVFEGSDVYEKGVDGPYHVRIEIRKVGDDSLLDTIERYTTTAYVYTDFSRPSSSINDTDDFINDSYLQVNVTAYSDSNTEYRMSGWLHGENWEYIGWAENTTYVEGEEEVILLFDGSIINNSGIIPDRVYLEMWRTSDWKLMDYGEFSLESVYSAGDFGAGVTIGEVTLGGIPEYDNPANGYDVLNISANITFTEGTYRISAGLVDQDNTWITGANIPWASYSGLEEINLSFDGLMIYMKGFNGPYTVSFISVAKDGSGEIARSTSVFTTAAYDATDFEHPSIPLDANLTGDYSSYVIDGDSDGKYDYLVVNVTVNATQASNSYNLYGDIYSSDATKWVAGDKNESGVYTWDGETIVQLYFEGNDVYDSETDGPYLLGFVRIGVNISGSWALLDEASNVYTTESYNYTDFENETMGALTPSDVSSITVSNDPFSPNSDGSYDTTLVTVAATASQTLYLNIYNATNVRKRTGLALSGLGESYTATWNGKDDGETVVVDGTYRIKVSDENTGDQANESAETKTLVVDTAAPTSCSVEISGNAEYTIYTNVTLTTVTATDNSSKKMRFKNDGGNWTDWEDFQSSRSWNLTSNDGSRTVYYQAKDVAGNTATSVTDIITLDTTKPSNVNITITGVGDATSTHSNSESVSLTISASDTTSGVEYMMIANDVTFTDRSWESYATSKDWTMTSGDGLKTVYIKAKDRAGKVSDVFTDNITLDKTDPTGLTISAGSGEPPKYTNSTNITLTLSATNATKMRVSNLANFSGANWESYSTSKNWTLNATQGTKTVYFQAKDTAGNIADSVNDTTTLDTTAPTINSLTAGSITTTSATITWDTTDASGDACTTQVEYGTTESYGTNTTLNATLVASHSVTLTGLTSGTTYYYRSKSKDKAGNLATSLGKSFSTSSGTDTTSPAAIVGLSVTDEVDAEKTLTISWNESDEVDWAGYKVYRKTSSFTNVSSAGVSLLVTISNLKSNVTYYDTTATDDTTFYYAVTAIDTATPPNENKTVISVSGTSLDDKPPVTSDNIPIGWQTSEVTVTLTATDSGKGVNFTYYTTDGSDPTNSSNDNRTQYIAPFTVGGDNDLGDGTWTIKYYSYDKNTTPNVEGIHTKTLKVDTVAPSTSDNAPSGWQNSTVTVVLSSTDNSSGVDNNYYTTDGSTPTIASSTYSSPILFTSNAINTLKYFTRDNATNSEEISTVNISIDTVIPTSSVTTLSTYSSTPFNVSWASSDATSGVAIVVLQVKNETGSWTNWLTGQNVSGTTSYTDASNGYTYYFRSISTDNASNVETDYDSSGDASTMALSDAPTAEISSPSNNEYVQTTVNFVGTASDVNFSKYWLNYTSDGTNWTDIANCTIPVVNGALGSLNTISLNETSYNISLTVANQTGFRNWYNITIIVDNTEPDMSSISSSVSSSSAATITWTTDEAATSLVEYGLTDSFGSTSSSSTYTTSHSRTLISLEESTTYYYRVTSVDQAGNENVSSTATFTTSAAPSSPPSSPPSTPPVPPPGETDPAPSLSNIYHEPTTITENDIVGIYATVIDVGGVESVTLNWNDGSSHSIDMTIQNDDIFFVEIGPISETTTVTYSIRATDSANQNTTSDEYSFTVTDDNGPTISVDSPSNGALINERNPKIQASYSDPSGIDTDSVTFTVDGVDVTALATITSSQISYSETNPMGYSIHTVTVTVSDDLGYSASKSWSFTIQAEEVGMVETIEEILEGEEGTVSYDEYDNPTIEEITIIAATDLGAVTVNCVTKGEKPVDVTMPPEDICYMYLIVDTNVDESDISSATINFKVEQIWFVDNDLEKDSVKLCRYSDDGWEELSTEFVDEDETYVYYEANTPGFSTFAIVGTSSIEPSGEGGSSSYMMIIIAVVSIMVILGLLYYKKRF